MQVKALKTFNGRMGLIRGGEIITVDDRYGRQLVGNKLAEPVRDFVEKSQKGPDSNKDLGNAPDNKGDEGDGGGKAGGSSQSEGDGNAAGSSEDQQAAGKVKPVSSRQVGRRSRKKT